MEMGMAGMTNTQRMVHAWFDGYLRKDLQNMVQCLVLPFFLRVCGGMEQWLLSNTFQGRVAIDNVWQQLWRIDYVDAVLSTLVMRTYTVHTASKSHNKDFSSSNLVL